METMPGGEPMTDPIPDEYGSHREKADPETGAPQSDENDAERDDGDGDGDDGHTVSV